MALAQTDRRKAAGVKTLAFMLKLNRAEWRWLLIWCGLTLGFSALPFVWGWLATPPGQEFTGVLFNGPDTNTYLAKMAEGRRGEWVFHLAHTSEGGDGGAVTFVYYLLLGKLAGLLGLSNILVFHLARLVNGAFLLIVSFGFIRLLFTEQKRQRWAFVLVCLSSGLGWLALLAGWLSTPPDFWVAEGYTFLSILANPHFPLATALTILVIVGWLVGQETGRPVYYVEAGLGSFLLGFIHPFMLFALGAVTGLFWLRQTITNRRPNWLSFGTLAAIGLVGGPGAFLTWWGTQNDPLLQRWMSQNQTITLDLFQSLIGYGLLVPLALFGAWWVERSLPKQTPADPVRLARWRLVTSWVVATVIMLLLPVSFSRRFEEGLHLPLCCLAAAGWYEVIALRLGLNFRRPLRQLLTLALVTTSLMLVMIQTAFLYLPHEPVDEPVRSPYFSAGERGALDWLNQNAQVGEVALAGPLLGNVLPGRTPVRVLYGHPMETLDAARKLTLVEQFFKETTPMATRYGIIEGWQVKYLVYGWREQLLGSFNPGTGGWPLVYDNDNVKIYRLVAFK